MCGVQMGVDRALWEEWVKLVVLGATVDAEVWGLKGPLCPTVTPVLVRVRA